MKMTTFLAAVFASVACWGNVSFDWKGRDGAVTIPANTSAVVLDEDIADVEALTSIVMADATSQIRFANTVGLTLSATVTGSGGGGKSYPNLTMDDSARVVFDGNVSFTGSSETYLTLSDCTVNASFGSTTAYYHVTVREGRTATFSETASVDRRYLLHFYGPGTSRFLCARLPAGNNTVAQFNWFDSKVVFGVADLSKAGGFFFNKTGDAGAFDLNGFDQHIPGISGGSDSASVSPSVVRVTSAAPATLTFNQQKIDGKYQPPVWNSSIAFEGALTVCYEGLYTNCLWNGCSTASGDLNVKAGVLKFCGNVRWTGPHVNVTGGRLVMDTERPALSEGTELSVSDGGVLEVPAGRNAFVGVLYLAGDRIEIGAGRSIAELSALEGGRYAPYLSGSGRIVPMTYYVDAEGGNDETGDGLSEKTAMKTLSALFGAYDVPGGSRVVALPGRYALKTMTAPTDMPSQCRVVVPAGVTLVSRDGPAATVIAGEQAKTEPVKNGCGPDAVRCVYLMSGARIEGFTLTDGYGYYNGSSVGSGNGSCVCAADANCVIADCTLRDSTAGNIAAGYKGKYYRCVIRDTSAVAGYALGLREAAAYGCLFSNSKGANGQVDQGTAVEFCTFVGTSTALRNTSGVVHGCVFDGVNPNSSDVKIDFVGCRMTVAPTCGTVGEGSEIVTTDALALDEKGRPTRGSCLVNVGDIASYRSAFGNEDRELDVCGVFRYQLGGLDIGAAEYDPREDFSAALAHDGSVSVTAVTTNVVAAVAGGISLPDTAEVEIDWRTDDRSTRYGFAWEVVGEGELRAYVDGAQEPSIVHTAGTGTEIIRATVGPKVRFAYVGAGTARLFDFRSSAHVVISVEKAGVTVEGAAVGTNAVYELPFAFSVARQFDSTDRIATGVLSNGVFLAFDDAEGGVIGFAVEDLFCTLDVAVVYDESLSDWYVARAAPDGADAANFGRHSVNPFRTLARAAGAAKSGDTIHVARGVYDEGCMCESDTKGFNRIVVPKDVRVVADEGRDVTIIEGAMAEPADARIQNVGSGTNSLRVAFLRDNARLEGFTLRNGFAQASEAEKGEYGGGVYAAKSSIVVDCTITNCHAVGAAAAYRAKLVNCAVVGNRSVYGYRVAVTDGDGIYGCFFKGNASDQASQGHLTDVREIVNCTFDGSCPGMRLTENVVVGVWNSIFLSNPIYAAGTGAICSFCNCILSQVPGVASEKYSLDGDCTVDASFALDGNLSPLSEDSAAVDSRPAGAYFNEKMTDVFGSDVTSWDARGGQRVYNGDVDIGAVEYDWRVIYARASACRGMRVEAVSPSVTCSSSARGLVFADGSVLRLAWEDAARAAGKWRYPISVKDGGTLVIKVSGVTVAELTEDAVWTYEASPSDVVMFAYAGTGSAEVRHPIADRGLVLIVR